MTPILSDDDKRFFDENGYVIARSVVPPENTAAVIAAIWEFLGMDPANPDDWYREPHKRGGMVEMYHHQALWNNRQHGRVHQAFCELLGTEKLWVSEDRAGMKAPSRPDKPDWDHKGFTHWDLDTSKPLSPALRVQGVLCLTDTTDDMGGFQCVPGFHKNLQAWIDDQPAGRNPRVPDLSRLPPGMTVTPIPAQAGDLIIWHNQLAHGNGHNVSDKPRLAQYITMRPAQASDEAARQRRIERYEKMLPYKEGDARGWEQAHYGPATLTPLGRKLLGIDLWED